MDEPLLSSIGMPLAGANSQQQVQRNESKIKVKRETT